MKQKYNPETVTTPKLVSGQRGWVWTQKGIRVATVNTVGYKEIIVLIFVDSKTAVAATILPSMFLAKDY
jgi:hypothetical protein